MSIIKDHRTIQRILACLLAFSVLISAFVISPLSAVAESELSDTTVPQSGVTYTISSAEQLIALSQIVAGGKNCAGATFRLTANIDLNPGVVFYSDGTYSATPTAFTPIGNGTTSFRGTFDGGSYTIRGIYINDTTQANVGLFGKTTNATISNVSIANSYIAGNGTVGGICGLADGTTTITNCTNSAYVVGSGKQTGGICGYLKSTSTITACANTASVISTAQAAGTPEIGVGGICGFVSSNDRDPAAISYSYNIANITAAGDHVGGIAGQSEEPIACCYNVGDIVGMDYVGGICGTSGTVRDAYNLGAINGHDAVGGIVGISGAAISCVYNVGSCTAEQENVGELYGVSQGSYDESSMYALTGAFACSLSKIAGSTLPSALDSQIWEKQESSAEYSYPALKNMVNPQLDCDAQGKLLQKVQASAPEAGNSSQTEQKNVTATYKAAAAASIVYCFDITWGSLEFDYTPASMGTWDPETHQYVNATQGSWTCQSGENLIKIVNHSNTAVTATFTYTPSEAYTGISGSFSTPTAEIASAVGTTREQAPSLTTALTLQGALTDTTAIDATIGQVTIDLNAK